MIFTKFKKHYSYIFYIILMLQELFQGYSQQLYIQKSNIRSPIKFRTAAAKIKPSGLQNYQLRQSIGEGGFSKVHKAVHKYTGQIVAVKIFSINPQNQQELYWIQKEIFLQKKILHQNIAQIYQIIRTQTQLYIFMEYCKNGELLTKINREGPLPQIQAGNIFNQILWALLYLKDNKLSHRDIKPQNIMFDENWKVKLIDFGFSCSLQESEFRKTICGSPSYTAPQIIKRSNYDPELSDVWSLGVTLYAMLSARLPFQGQNDRQRKNNILSKKFIQQPLFSTKAQNLFSSIFVDAKYRARLIDLKMSEFSMISTQYIPKFIDFTNQTPVLQQQIVKMISRDYKLDSIKVTNSVCRSQFDSCYANYYLTLEYFVKNRKNDQSIYLNKYKKQKKGSIIKLQPLAYSLLISKKQNDTKRTSSLFRISKKLQDYNQFVKVKFSTNLDTARSRSRKRYTDSPYRLIY